MYKNPTSPPLSRSAGLSGLVKKPIDCTAPTKYHHIISSPKPSDSQGELIVYPCSGVRPLWSVRRGPPVIVHQSTISNIFSSDSETAWPIETKFYVEPPWEGGTKVYINGPGHMTKMAATPIYGKNLKKSSSPEPEVL